jgi:hypothetical protein
MELNQSANLQIDRLNICGNLSLILLNCQESCAAGHLAAYSVFAFKGGLKVSNVP